MHAHFTACLLQTQRASLRHLDNRPCMQTVTAEQALKAAKPLAQPDIIDKDKVWLIIVGGAASLFILVWLIENLTNFFPAISRANKAMSARRDYYEQQDAEQRESSGSMQDREATGRQRAKEEEMKRRSEDAVARGLQAAREKVMQDQPRQ